MTDEDKDGCGMWFIGFSMGAALTLGVMLSLALHQDSDYADIRRACRFAGYDTMVGDYADGFYCAHTESLVLYDPEAK